MTYDDPVLVARHGNEYYTLPNFEEITRLAHTKHQLETCFSLIDTCFFFGWQMPSLVIGRHGSPAVEKKHTYASCSEASTFNSDGDIFINRLIASLENESVLNILY